MSERDKSSKTWTAGRLIAELSKVHPDTPVVIEQSDEPLGDYGVRSVEIRDMKRDETYAADPFGKDVWHEARWLNECPNSRSHDRFDPPQQVVFLGDESPYRPVVDGELAPLELEEHQ